MTNDKKINYDELNHLPISEKLDLNISELGFLNIIIKSLYYVNIKKIKDLINEKTIDIRNVMGIGKTTYDEIELKLNLIGLSMINNEEIEINHLINNKKNKILKDKKRLLKQIQLLQQRVSLLDIELNEIDKQYKK